MQQEEAKAIARTLLERAGFLYEKAHGLAKPETELTLPPLVIAIFGGAIIPLLELSDSFSSAHKKRALAQFIGAQLEQGHVDAFVTISEAWMVERKGDEVESDVMPRDDPKRQEYLIANIYTLGVVTAMRQQIEAGALIGGIEELDGLQSGNLVPENAQATVH